jgi:hypothetical protein
MCQYGWLATSGWNHIGEKHDISFALFQALGMPQEAIVCYQRALQAKPNYAMAFGECFYTL